MAVSGRGSKTNVFWAKDPDDQDEQIVKVHIPGLILESNSDVQHPMVRKPVHMRKPRVVTLQTSLHNSLERRRQLKEATNLTANLSKAGTDSFSAGDARSVVKKPGEDSEKSKRHLSLKELNPEDKKRVANLVKELAKVGEEREHAEERLQVEREAFEERLLILQEEYDGIIKEKQYLQKRFLELQSLLVKYQSNGRTPSPKRAVRSQVSEERGHEQVFGTFSNVSPGRSPHFLPLEDPSPTQNPGNARPVNSGSVSNAGRESAGNTEGSPHRILGQEADVTAAMHSNTGQKLGELKSGSSRPSSTMSGNMAGSYVGKVNVSQQGHGVTASMIGSSSGATPSTAQATALTDGQAKDIPQSSRLKLQPGEPDGISIQTSSAVATHPQAPAVYSQSALNPGSVMMSLYPPQVKPTIGVLAGGITEPRGDWRNMPPRKNEDRSFSEASAVSGTFSAELDAVYRLYCREYELQLQLQQQQIELQKQQVQLQQQLQQVETLQQQQQQQQQQPATQWRHPPPNYVTSATEVPGPAGHDKQRQTVVNETPAPSPAPNPATQPHRISPARSLIPTPEDRSVTLSSHRSTPDTEVEAPRGASTARDHMLHDDRPAATESWRDATEQHRARLRAVNKRTEKENRDPLIPVSRDRVLSAPPSLGHPRLQSELRHVPRHLDEVGFSAEYDDRRRLASEHERYSGGRSAVSSRSSVHTTDNRHSLHGQRRDMSTARDINYRMPLEERPHQNVSTGNDVFTGSGRRITGSGRRISGSREEVSLQTGTRSDRANSTINSTHSDRSTRGLRETNRQLSQGEPYTIYTRNRDGYKMGTGDSEVRYSLYRGVERFDRELRGHRTADEEHLGADEVMALGQRRLELNENRAPIEGSYPRSLVDIVERLENKEGRQETSLTSPPRITGGLDTTDSGYSQERSPLDNYLDDVNSDEEEATVLEDIFFLSGRF